MNIKLARIASPIFFLADVVSFYALGSALEPKGVFALILIISTSVIFWISRLQCPYCGAPVMKRTVVRPGTIKGFFTPTWRVIVPGKCNSCRHLI